MSRIEAFNAGTTPGNEDMPMEHYGVSVVPAYEERGYRKFHSNEQVRQVRRVPIDNVVAGQHTVEHDTVQRYATGKNSNPETPVGAELPDGRVMLEDGHHRLAAAKLLGHSTFPVHVRIKYGPRYPGTEGRW